MTQEWPIRNYSTRWFSVAFEDDQVRDALWLSLFAGLGATAVSLVLGTLASIAVSRYRFFGREVISFAVILPIALPGIITGLALQATILDVLGPLGLTFGLATIILGHATFCVVVVYNNAIARLRRTAGSLDEASADLGADSLQTFRYVMFPQLRSALLAGGLLAFALSFDEVIVTIFTAGAQQTLHLDLRDPVAARGAADRERRRAPRDLHVDHPRVLRAADRGRECARERAPCRRSRRRHDRGAALDETRDGRAACNRLTMAARFLAVLLVSTLAATAGACTFGDEQGRRPRRPGLDVFSEIGPLGRSEGALRLISSPGYVEAE